MPPPSCVMIGSESLLVHCAEIWLQRGHVLQAVVSDDPAIREWGHERVVPTFAPDDDLADALGRLEFDYLFSISYLRLLPAEILAMPRVLPINFHDGPLPRYAGLNAPIWALLAGEPAHGISWHVMTAAADEGELLLQREFAIAADETALTLNTRCYEAAIESFGALAEAIASGSLTRTPQPLAGRSVFRRADRPEAGGLIDWSQSADALERLVRALDTGGYANPVACAKCEVGTGGLAVGVGELRSLGVASDAPPGSFIGVTEEGALRVATGTEDVAISRLRGVDGARLAPAAVMAQPGVTPGAPLAASPLSRDRVDTVVRDLAPHEPFWVRRLGRLAPVSLPMARPRSGGATPRQRAVSLSFPATDGPVDLHVTPIVAQIARTTGHHRFDLSFRDPALTRRLAGAEPLTAPRVPLRFDLDPDAAYLDWQEAVASELARVRRRGSFLRDVNLRFPSLSSPGGEGAGSSLPIAIEIVEDLGDPQPAPGAELTWLLDRGGRGAICLYDEDAFSEAEIRAIQSQVLRVADAGRSDPQQPVSRMPLLGEREQRQMWVEWNATERPFERDRGMHDLVTEQAARTPEATAVVCGREVLTYAQLEARANQLAHHLQSCGVAHETRVGLCLERSVDMVVAMLGIQKAGAAYVPLDPSFPTDRLAFMIEDAAMPLIVTQESLRGLLAGADARLLCLDTDRAALRRWPEDPPPCSAGPDSLAYVIYTSGSTGRPKGVQVEHRNVVNFFAGMDDRIPHADPGVWLAVTSLSFDISVLELGWTLARGFTVVIHDERRETANPAPAQRYANRPIDFSLFYFSSDACDEGEAGSRYRLLLEGARFADENGFAAVWTPERHFHAFGGLYPNPAVTGAAVAAITRNIEIRAGSVVLPLHHPARVVEEWSVVDNLSNGRVALAFAAGWQPNDFVLRPENHAEAKTRMLEAIDVVRTLWAGGEATFEGPRGPVTVQTLPRPIQPELPVYITTAGNPETYEIAGQRGAHVLTHLLGQSIEQLAEKLARYRQAWRDAGHPGEGRVSLMLHTFVSRMEEDALRETVRGPLKGYLATAMSLVRDAAYHFPTFQDKQRVSGKSLEEIFADGFSEEEQEALLEFAFDRYYETSGLFGSPESCIARIDELKGIGVDDVACLIDFGVPTDLALDGLKDLAVLRERTQPGATLASADSLLALARRYGVTHFQCTPSMARMLLGSDETRGVFRDVEHVMLGGEALPMALVRQIAETSSGRIVNMYGPTETTIWSTTGEVDPADEAVALGSPVANTQLYVVDANLEPLPPGCPGELVIGGEGVVRGYLNRPDLTAERFVEDRLGARPGGRLYRTGDRVRWDEGGRLTFLGRIDHQVKIRGHRIEPGEIESRLQALAEIREAVVVAREDTPGDQRLIAYVVAAHGRQVDEAMARARLRDALPEPMVPAQIVVLEALPLTPNAKIDRQALPAPSSLRGAGRRVGGPTPDSPLQRTLAEIWERALGIEGVGLDDSFFDLGGHSLLVVQVHREIKEAVPGPLSITDLFRLPTLRALSEHLSGEAEDGAVARNSESRAAARRDAMSRRRRRRG